MVIFKISTIYPENDNLLSVKLAELCQFTFPAFESKKSVQKCPTGGVTTKGICTTKGRWPYLSIKSGVTLDEINPTLSDQLIGYY